MKGIANEHCAIAIRAAGSVAAFRARLQTLSLSLTNQLIVGDTRFKPSSKSAPKPFALDLEPIFV